MAEAPWPLWEVFVRSQHGLAHRHVDLRRPETTLGLVHLAGPLQDPRLLGRRAGHDARVVGQKHEREPEGADPFDFELLVDFGAYRDIGRHRKGFQQQQTLSTSHGYLIPPLMREAGLADEFATTLDRVAEITRTRGIYA